MFYYSDEKRYEVSAGVLLEYNSCVVTYSSGCVSRGQRLKCWV